MFIVEIDEKYVNEFDTFEEAEDYIKKNNLKNAEVYDHVGRLISFYSKHHKTRIKLL